MSVLAADDWLEHARAFAREGFVLRDLCGLDRAGLSARPGEQASGAGFEDELEGHRFEVVVQLLHYERKERRTVHVAAAGEPPRMPSVVEVWPVANFMEREAFDMFGIEFEGHPNLTRILMPDEWQGHPLRKDYGVGKVPIEFVPQPFLQIDAPGQAPDPEEAHREVDRLGQSGAPDRDWAEDRFTR